MTDESKGRRGEDAAVRYLESEGYRVLRRNFRTRRGEIDVVGLDAEEVVFVEVKTWDAYGFDSLEYALSERKRRRIINAARVFLSRNQDLGKRNVRFDCLFLNGDGNVREHVRSAFVE